MWHRFVFFKEECVEFNMRWLTEELEIDPDEITLIEDVCVFLHFHFFFHRLSVLFAFNLSTPTWTPQASLTVGLQHVA